MTNEGADQPVRCQKNEESLIPVYRPVRSGLTSSTGTSTDKEKALPVPSLTRTPGHRCFVRGKGNIKPS
jgi:hypothetical protein